MEKSCIWCVFLLLFSFILINETLEIEKSSGIMKASFSFNCKQKHLLYVESLWLVFIVEKCSPSQKFDVLFPSLGDGFCGEISIDLLWASIIEHTPLEISYWRHMLLIFASGFFMSVFFFLFVGQFHALIMMNREMTPLTGNEDLFSMYEFIKIHGILKNQALMAKKLLSQSFPLTCSWWWSIRNKCSDEIVNYMGLLINVCQKVHFLINNFVD